MKEGWKYVKLGDIGTFSRGINFLKTDFVEKGFPCVHYGQIHTKLRNITKEHLTCIPETLVKKDKLASKGDILIAITSEDVAGSCKCTAWLGDYDIALGAHAACFKHNQNPAFIVYFFQSRQFYVQKEQFTHGFKVVEIKPSDIAKITIPLPPLSEQQRIVTFLDTEFAKIDALKAKAEQSLQNAKDLFQAALKEEMTPKEDTPMIHIGETFKSFSGGTPIKSNKEYYNNGNIPWLRSGEVCKKYINETEMFITEAGLKNSSAKYYPVNTVVIAMYGATAAQVGILKIEATSNQAVCGLLPNDSYLPEYVYYWFSAIQKDLAAQAQGGAQPNISQEKIKKVLIPIMNIEEQEAIVARLDTLRTLVSSLEQKYSKIAAECDALKQAILKQVFE